MLNALRRRKMKGDGKHQQTKVDEKKQNTKVLFNISKIVRTMLVFFVNVLIQMDITVKKVLRVYQYSLLDSTLGSVFHV